MKYIAFILFIVIVKILTYCLLEKIIYKRKLRSLPAMLQVKKVHMLQFIPLFGLGYIIACNKKQPVHWGFDSEYGNVDCGRIFWLIQAVTIVFMLKPFLYS